MKSSFPQALFICIVMATLLYLLVFTDVLLERAQVATLEAFDPDVPGPDSRQGVNDKYKLPTRGENNIIFVETTCMINATARYDNNGALYLTLQQLCAVESAARTNPNASVYVFYSCPMAADSIDRASAVVQMVFQHTNVHVWHQSMDSFFESTPLADFHRTGVLKTSKYPITQGSDVLRFLVLWKFGGIYLDLDFIVLRTLAELGSNFAGIESTNYLNSAAMGLSASGSGRQIAIACIEELRDNFNGEIWGYNGPMLITRVIQKFCGDVIQTELMTLEACKNFAVLPTSVFYPIIYQEWRTFFNEQNSTQIMKKIQDSMAVHLWRSRSFSEGGDSIRKGSKQPIALLERKFCPTVYNYNP